MAFLWLWDRAAQCVISQLPSVKSTSYSPLITEFSSSGWTPNKAFGFQVGLCLGCCQGIWSRTDRSSISVICGVVSLCCVSPIQAALLASQSGNGQTTWVMETAHPQKCDLAGGGSPARSISVGVSRLDLQSWLCQWAVGHWAKHFNSPEIDFSYLSKGDIDSSLAHLTESWRELNEMMYVKVHCRV